MQLGCRAVVVSDAINAGDAELARLIAAVESAADAVRAHADEACEPMLTGISRDSSSAVMGRFSVPGMDTRQGAYHRGNGGGRSAAVKHTK